MASPVCNGSRQAQRAATGWLSGHGEAQERERSPVAHGLQKTLRVWVRSASSRALLSKAQGTPENTQTRFAPHTCIT